MKRRILWICGAFALLTAIYPFTRAFFRMEVSYNEGWNIYNASTVANHQLLYPAKYGWTTVNYPMLSFVLFAQLHRFTHEYLFTARVVSLLSVIGCGILVALIVRRLTNSWYASTLAGFYCLAIFCTCADGYVGVDDPQMLSLAFFLAGFLLYLWRRESLLVICGTAAVFVIGGCIKHNPIDFPLAVLLELALLSWRRALWFSIWGILFAGIAIAVNIHYGGPYFIAQVLTPRGFSFPKMWTQSRDVLGPMLIPLCVGCCTALTVLKDEKKRIVAILLATSLAFGFYFNGGQGVSINAEFSALLAIAILSGIFFDEAASGKWLWPPSRSMMPDASYAPLLFFAWLIIPAIIWGVWNPVQSLRDTAAAQRRFDADVSFLRGQNGPVLCESLLRCYFAGKPYLYDPFNATRLIEFGKLDANAPINAIRQQQDAAIELDKPIQTEYEAERFNPRILDAIQENYAPALEHQDAIIFVPKAKTDDWPYSAAKESPPPSPRNRRHVRGEPLHRTMPRG